MITESPLDHFMQKLDGRMPLEPAERDAILALPGHAIQVASNRDFVRLGEDVTHACLVVEGLVARFSQNRKGERQITALHIAGDMANLHSVVVPEARSALQALCVTTLLKVPHQALREAATKYPRLAAAFWRENVIDGAVLSEWVVNVGRRCALAAMAHILCEMACRYRNAEISADMDYDFAATQTHLGDMLGLTPIHVNRKLMELRELNVVTFVHKRVTIHDWAKLITIGEFDPNYLHLPRVPIDPNFEPRSRAQPRLAPASSAESTTLIPFPKASGRKRQIHCRRS